MNLDPFKSYVSFTHKNIIVLKLSGRQGVKVSYKWWKGLFMKVFTIKHRTLGSYGNTWLGSTTYQGKIVCLKSNITNWVDLSGNIWLGGTQ